MLPILPTPDLDRILLHLNPLEQKDPVSVLAELCEEFPPGVMRLMFNKMQKIVLLDDYCNHPNSRDIQILYGDMVLKALEACYLICRDRAPTPPAAAKRP